MQLIVQLKQTEIRENMKYIQMIAVLLSICVASNAIAQTSLAAPTSTTKSCLAHAQYINTAKLALTQQQNTLEEYVRLYGDEKAGSLKELTALLNARRSKLDPAIAAYKSAATTYYNTVSKAANAGCK